MSNEKVLSKIKKLLNLSGNNSNVAEAESAMLKAQQLMMEHQIEEHQLHGDVSEVKIVEIMCTQPANTPWAMHLITIFEKNFGVLHFYKGSKVFKIPTYFGEQEKVELCVALYDYTVVWLNKKACNYATKMRNEKGIVKGIKQDFIVGFLKGLQQKFQNQVDTNNQYALVVIVSPEVTTAYDAKVFSGTVKPTTMKVHGSIEARSAGFTEGKYFDANNTKERLT